MIHVPASSPGTPAPFGKRFVAMTIDLGIISALSYAIALSLLLITGLATGVAAIGSIGAGFSPAVLIVLGALLALALMAFYHGYYIRFEYKRGATPGKRLMGMRVVSLKGPSLTLRQCVVRQLLRDADLLLVVSGPLAWALTERRQKLGDLAASTMVVHSDHEERRGHHMYLERDEYLRLLESCRCERLDRVTAERYLEFAHPVFVMGSRAPGPGEAEGWERVIRALVPEAGASALERRKLFLFFAEHCFQFINHSQ